MGFGNTSGQVCVRDFFSNKIDNKSALKCYGDVDNADYSGFETNFSKYLNEKSISEMIKVNDEITNVMKGFKISIKINMNILNNLVSNHLPQTTNIALGMIKYLPKDVQKDVNKNALKNATGLHDIAKVIIPESIINKPGKLNEDELKIMREHARLSYEMLKTTDLDAESLNLIKAHHQSHQDHHSSNPITASREEVTDVNLQILSMADIYSALRERRSYKKEMSKEDALGVIKKETDNGKFHPCVYQALEKYAYNDERNPYEEHKTPRSWSIFKYILNKAKGEGAKEKEKTAV